MCDVEGTTPARLYLTTIYKITICNTNTISCRIVIKITLVTLYLPGNWVYKMLFYTFFYKRLFLFLDNWVNSTVIIWCPIYTCFNIGYCYFAEHIIYNEPTRYVRYVVLKERFIELISSSSILGSLVRRNKGVVLCNT